MKNMKNMMKMMRDAQKMQEKLQSELAEMKISATSGGGVVTATVSGTKQLLELKLAPEAIDPDDPEMLQDLIVAAINEAHRRADEAAQEKVGGMIPGGAGGALGGMLG